MSIEEICTEAARVRQGWDALRPELERSLERLQVTMRHHTIAVWKADAEREAVRNLRLSVRKARFHACDILKVLPKQKPE
jgi:CHAD domain-containing protein